MSAAAATTGRSASSSPPRAPAATAPYLLGGLLVIILMLGGLGLWAAQTRIAGAVLAAGSVVVDSNVKKVQHPTGGIVGALLIKEGDAVSGGDLLIRLDDTVTRANLQLIVKQMDELKGREARLFAERTGVAGVVVPPDLIPRLSEAGLQAVFAGEQSLLLSRRAAGAGKKAQLRERIAQLHEEIAGLSAQVASKATEIALIAKELDGLLGLEQKQLVTTNRLTALRREAARIEGERGSLQAQAAQAKGRITEIELQILQVDQDLRSEVDKDLRETQSRLAELAERRIAAEDQLKRIDIRAPQPGTVHQLAVHTVGGVINAGEPIMLIVPEGDRLVAEVRIAPQDIDQVSPGARAFVRFAAFNQRTTPELKAHVARISADLVHDPQDKLSYYLARLEFPTAELDHLGTLKLVPGMPAEAHITTADRTVLSYLVKPIEDQLAKAFREQ